MKKYLLLFLLLILGSGAFALTTDFDIDEKKPLPKYMYIGEKLDLEKYFDLKDVSSVTCEPVFDKKIYPELPNEIEVTPEESEAYNKKVEYINETFRIVKVLDRELVPQKPGNTEITLTFYFDNSQRTEVKKNYNITIIDYDQQQWQDLSDRYNIKKIITKRIVWTVIVVVIILLIIWAIIARKKKLERIRAKRKQKRPQY